LKKASNKIPAEKTVAEWSNSHSLTKKSVEDEGCFKSLDEIFTDESVRNILFTCHVLQTVESQDVCNHLIKNNVTNICKRKKSDGKFSDFDVKQFGFPADSIFDSDDSDDGCENNDVIESDE